MSQTIAKPTNELSDLKDSILLRHPQAQVTREVLPSGLVYIDVRLNGEAFVLELGKDRKGFGVSRITKDTGLSGADHAFDNWDEAKQCLMELIANQG